MFKHSKDKTYYKKKANKLEIELEVQRQIHANNTILWTKQIEDIQASLDYKTEKLKNANKQIKKLKERIKELETPKRKK